MPVQQGTELLAGIAAGTHDRDLQQRWVSLIVNGAHDRNTLVKLLASATAETRHQKLIWQKANTQRRVFNMELMKHLTIRKETGW